MNKGTVGFGFRSPVEYTCLKSDFHQIHLEEIREIFFIALGKNLEFQEPFENQSFGTQFIKVIGRIENLNSPIIYEKQQLLKSLLKEKSFKIKDIS